MLQLVLLYTDLDFSREKCECLWLCACVFFAHFSISCKKPKTSFLCSLFYLEMWQKIRRKHSLTYLFNSSNANREKEKKFQTKYSTFKTNKLWKHKTYICFWEIHRKRSNCTMWLKYQELNLGVIKWKIERIKRKKRYHFFWFID